MSMQIDLFEPTDNYKKPVKQKRNIDFEAKKILTDCGYYDLTKDEKIFFLAEFIAQHMPELKLPLLSSSLFRPTVKNNNDNAD